MEIHPQKSRDLNALSPAENFQRVFSSISRASNDIIDLESIIGSINISK